MSKFRKKFNSIISNKSLMKKIRFTLWILALYRLLVHIPVPFVNIDNLMGQIGAISSSGLWYLVMMMWWSLDNFSIIAIWLSPYINASIIMQLLWAVIPSLEQLTEEWEAWQQKINQYTRYLSIPLAFLQWIGMVFFINATLWWNVIDTSAGTLILAALAMTVGSVILMRLWELITEKWIANGISILIFSSIVAWITQSVYWSFSGTTSIWWMLLFMLIIVLVLIVLSIFILKSVKEIPIIYARKGKVQESSILPIPMNPVWMIPIIFAMAFVSFPYLLAQIIKQFQPMNNKLNHFAERTEIHLNIYSQQPGVWAVLLYFILIVAFTFFYTLIVFSPEKMSDNIQKRWGFVPGIRPWKETSTYINRILMHLCLWWWLWLALVGIYSYILNYIPFIQNLVASLWSLPVVVTWSGVIIIVWVVQEIINKIETDLIMQRYEKYDAEEVNKSLREL